eukprot:scaffold20285_cov107-Skeletonema_dohrnii-CCMP3373.AAC.2
MSREVMRAIKNEGGRFVEYNGTNYVELLDDVALPIIFQRLIPGRLKKPRYLIRTITTKTEIEPAPTHHNNNKRSTANNNVTTTNNTDGGPASSTRSKNRSSLQQLGASEIDTKIAPHQFRARLCLMKTSPNTDFAFTPGRTGPGQTVSVNKLWPALKFNTYYELKDQLKVDNKRKAMFAIAATKLAKKAGISIGKAGFAYLLGKGDHANFLAILKKNDSGELIEDGEIFDFSDSMIEMESAEGYCASSKFQQAFKIAMARMEIEQGMEESGEDVMPVQVTTVKNSAKKTSMEGQPAQDEEARKEKPRRASPRKKKQDVPVETVEFNGKEATASDTSSFGEFGAELAAEQDDEDADPAGKKGPKDIPSTPVAYGFTNWAGMWNSMQDQGWVWMPGDGLVDWYYVHPNFAQRSKSEVLKEGIVGQDYFVNEESMMRYAKEYLGFKGRVKTPESNNNNGGQRRGRKRSAAVATTAEPIVEAKKERKKNSKAGKKQAGKKRANETKGKEKTKIRKSTYESESVDEGRKCSAAAVATEPIEHNQVLGHNENELAFRQMQLTIEQHSKEINLLKDKMKNSRANERAAAAAEADAEAARREKNDAEASLRDVQEDLELQQETTEQVAVTLDIWQSRFDRVYKLAEAAGVDNALLRSIRDGHMR